MKHDITSVLDLDGIEPNSFFLNCLIHLLIIPITTSEGHENFWKVYGREQGLCCEI